MQYYFICNEKDKMLLFSYALAVVFRMLLISEI